MPKSTAKDAKQTTTKSSKKKEVVISDQTKIPIQKAKQNKKRGIGQTPHKPRVRGTIEGLDDSFEQTEKTDDRSSDDYGDDSRESSEEDEKSGGGVDNRIKKNVGKDSSSEESMQEEEEEDDEAVRPKKRPSRKATTKSQPQNPLQHVSENLLPFSFNLPSSVHTTDAKIIVSGKSLSLGVSSGKSTDPSRHGSRKSGNVAGTFGEKADWRETSGIDYK